MSIVLLRCIWSLMARIRSAGRTWRRLMLEVNRTAADVAKPSRLTRARLAQARPALALGLVA